MQRRSTQVVVLGAGPGGYAAAFRAADLGLEVTLVDPEPNPGGVCLYRGCIPSKALLHLARVLREAREVEQCGVRFGKPSVDLERVRAWKGQVVSQLTTGLGQLGKARGMTYLQGRGVLLDARTLQVDCIEPSRVELSFEHAILATGSRSANLPAMHQESSRIMNSSAALALDDVPESLLVVGGGYIGLELGTVYAELGSSVTVAEMQDELLMGVDSDLTRIVAKSLEKRFAAIHLGTKVVSLDPEQDSVGVVLLHGNEERHERFSKVLVAVGRRPNSSGIGLETTRVQTDDSGFVAVDEARRTAEPTLYAIGDLVGEPLLAHKAAHEGIVAAEAIAGHRVAFDPQAIPAVVFTDPEVAWCGLTEARARAEGREVKTARFPWQASGRAATLARSDGLTKLVVDPQTERVLGVAVVGVGAGELIAEGVLAIEMGAVAADLAATIHPHPTLSETLMEAADAFYGRSLHFVRRVR